MKEALAAGVAAAILMAGVISYNGLVSLWLKISKRDSAHWVVRLILAAVTFALFVVGYSLLVALVMWLDI